MQTNSGSRLRWLPSWPFQYAAAGSSKLWTCKKKKWSTTTCYSQGTEPASDVLRFYARKRPGHRTEWAKPTLREKDPRDRNASCWFTWTRVLTPYSHTHGVILLCRRDVRLRAPNPGRDKTYTQLVFFFPTTLTIIWDRRTKPEGSLGGHFSMRSAIPKNWATRKAVHGHKPTYICGNFTREPDEISVAFNKYFIDSVQNLAHSFGTRTKEIFVPNPVYPVFNIMDDLQVSKYSQKLAKDINGWDSSFFKSNKEVLLAPLTHLVNLSISQSTFPNAWKSAVVTYLQDWWTNRCGKL